MKSYDTKLKIFEQYLSKSLPKLPKPVAVLEDSINYSLLAGGKRIRPILMLSIIEATGKNFDFALPVAAAIEYIHTYSLIHDDLPIIDNDELRRGKPTNHIIYGEDIALLAGDALLTHAFALICDDAIVKMVPPNQIIRIIKILSEKAGIFGMISGQTADIKKFFPELNSEQALDFIHRHKTGALISASVQIGAILGEVSQETFERLRFFGDEIGKCFQIQDDILDETGSVELLGKKPGSDKKNMKLTYPAVFGLATSKKIAEETFLNAIHSLKKTELNTKNLVKLASFVLNRKC